MALSKPSWLRSMLDRLNWDIFTWKVYVGDAIELGIDWALDWINWSIDQASRAYNKALEAISAVVELAGELRSRINAEIYLVLNRISTWGSILSDWWSARRQDVKDWIEAAKDLLKDLIDDAWIAIGQINVAWDNFRFNTLPGLVDFDNIRAWFGEGFKSLSDWWAARWQQIREANEAEIKPIRDEVNRHTTWLDLVREFFADPQQFLYDTMLKVIERFW